MYLKWTVSATGLFSGTVGVGVGSAGFNAEFSRKQRFNLMQDDDPTKNISVKSGK